MKTLETLFEQVELHVQDQQEQDEWEKLAKGQFDGLVEHLFTHVEALLRPLEARLAKYASESVGQVWRLGREENRFKICFGTRELEFRPIGAQAKQSGDRFTVHILRKNEELVGRYFLLLQPGTTELRLGFLGHSSVAERLEDRHLTQLFLDELLSD